jgi:hypothetical protein
MGGAGQLAVGSGVSDAACVICACGSVAIDWAIGEGFSADIDSEAAGKALSAGYLAATRSIGVRSSATVYVPDHLRVSIGECCVLDDAEDIGGNIIAYSGPDCNNDTETTLEDYIIIRGYKRGPYHNGDCVSYSDGVEATGATTDCDELGRTHGDDAKKCELADDRVSGRLGHHGAWLAYSAMEESMMTELGAPVVGLRALFVEVTNSTGFWDGSERRYPSVSWETYVLCSYVWGRVRSILLLAVQVSPDNTRFGVRAHAPRRRRAGNAYVMTSSVERVEVLAGVLIVLSISYGKVSTAEVMVEVDSIDLLSCGAGVAADARACVYRLYGVERRRETRMEEVEA